MALHPTILKSADGQPAFVVLSYAEYLRLARKQTSPANRPDPRIPADGTLPHEVIERMTRNNWSIVRAWREYLGITQADMAARLSIRQPSYAAMEAPDARPRRATRERLAVALGIQFEQMDV